MSYSSQEDYKVKFVILAKILYFVEWPKNSMASDNNIHFAIYGSDPFNAMLKDHSKNRDINGRKLLLQLITSTDDDLSGINVLFVPKEYNKEVKTLIAKVKGTQILLVTECFNCAKKGSAINLYSDSETGQVKIIVNKTTINETEINLSSKIYRIAKVVE